jgi:hypothetical protein
MGDLHAIADCFEIEALRGEFTDAVMTRDVYHHRYERTPEGWKVAERVYEVRYRDSTPLTGSAPSRRSD